MSFTGESEKEREPNIKSSLHRLYNDIHWANTYMKLQEAVPSYLSREFAIESPGDAWRLADRLTSDISLPNELDYDVNPQQAKNRTLMYMYGTLVPLHEDMHTAAESVHIVDEAIRYSTQPSSRHSGEMCVGSIYDMYEPCEKGDCPPRYIVSHISGRIVTLDDWAQSDFLDQELLSEKVDKLKNHIEAAWSRDLLLSREAEMMTHELEWHTKRIGASAIQPHYGE